MSDTGRKPLTDQAQEKLTPDSQKSTADQAKEGVSNTADSVAGLVQPGDSKSTTQKLSDQTSSSTSSAQDSLSGATKNIQDTASNLGQAAQDNLSAATKNVQDTAANVQKDAQEKGYLAQAQDVAVNALNTASKAAADLASSISGEQKK